MTQPVTLGELFRLAQAHLHAASRLDDRPDPESVAAALDQAGRCARALSRYLDDIIAGHQAEVILALRPGTLLHSAAHTRNALTRAADSFRAAATAASPPGPPGDGMAAELAQAAGCLTAGRDLLRSHFATSDEGTRSPLSWWSAAITSPPVSGAILDYIGAMSAQAGLWTASVTHQAVGHSGAPQIVGAELGKAARWLSLAASCAVAPQRSSPVTPAHRSLLAAIPASAVPARQPPAAGEPSGVLCHEITGSAERVRAWAHWQRGELPWRAGLTADSWRWTATAVAVACDVIEAAGASLRARATTLNGCDPADRRLLNRIGARAREACASWRQVAAAWKCMTTEHAGLTSPVIADVGDLVLRLGRLTFDDPLWSPARARDAVLRDPGDLAPGIGDLAGVLAAAHQASDAIAALSAADRRSVADVVSARALYTPARAMPESHTRIARRFHPALDEDTAALSDAYARAARASSALVRILDKAALRFEAPSQLLAIARTQQPGHVPQPPAQPPAASIKSAAWTPPGSSVESVVRGLRVYDPLLLFRAAAVDEAARQVMTDAWAASGTGGPRALRGEWHYVDVTSARKAASVAAQNFPQPQAQAPGTGERPAGSNKPGPRARNPGRFGTPGSRAKPALPK